MSTVKSNFFQIIKRKESLLFLVLLIAGISLLGWLSGEIGLAAISSAYIPIAPVTAIIFIILCILSFVNINQEKSRLAKLLVTFFVIIIAFFCGIMFLNHTFNLPWDIENVFIKNPDKLGSVQIGHMSPITSVLFVFICIIILIRSYNNSNVFNYIGAGISLFVCLVSSVLLLGYLYKAPLLYGITLIPVSLPAAVCFLLFSLTLVLKLDLKFWTFNLIKDNKITFQLLKSFLPFAVFTVLLQGFLITNISVRQNNMSLLIALIALMVVAFIVFTVIRVSGNLGDRLHEAEQAIKDSENKYQNLVNNVGEGIGFVDTNEHFIFSNSSAEKIFGVGEGELIGKNLKEFFSEEKYLLILDQTRMRKEGKVSTYESEIILPDGKVRFILITAVPQFDDEVFVGTYGIFRDITEQKQIMAQLQDSKDYLNNIINSVGSPVFVKDDKHKFVLVNTAFCLFLDLHAEELIGKTGYERFPIDQWDVFMAKDKEVFDTGKENVNEEFITDGNGEIRTIITRKTLYTDVYGNRFLVGIINDITESKHAGLKIQQQNFELTKLNADKDRFISILGHDLKNPFNNILGFSEILTEDIRNLNLDEIEDIARNINKSARITNKLLEDILLWARTQQGKIAFEPQNLNFKVVCLETLGILYKAAGAKNISVKCIAADQLIVFADINMLKTVLRNLVSNAIKFTNHGGVINIKSVQNSENVTISVSDNGVGIPPENLAKLFDISQVLTTTGTAEETGTGLGLLLCKEFVEKHGGKIWVESESGKGATFYFSLPASEERET